MQQSTKYNLNSTDWKKVGKGLLIAFAGYLVTSIVGVILQTDFTFHYQQSAINLTPFVWMATSAGANAFHKWMSGVAN